MAIRAVRRISATPPSIAAELRELLSARNLFALLVGRELKVRYRQTALGAVWVVLQPLLPAVIFAIVLGTFARLPSSSTPYLLFALSGLILFGLLSSSATRASSAFIRDGQLVTKVYVPRAILPLAAGAASALDFAVGAALLVALMLAMGSIPGVPLLLAPIVVAATLALGLMVGLALAGLGARYRDFLIAVPFLFQALMYASPIVYSAELVPSGLRWLYALNPMTALTELFRWTLFGSTVLEPGQIALGLLVGAVLGVISVVVFSRSTRDLTDVV